MVGQETSIEDQERLRDRLGLNDPLASQYLRFVGNLSRAEFGFSYRTRQPVREMILSRMPATLELGAISLIISLLIGIPAGIYTALKRGVLSNALLIATLVGISVPTFVIGIFLIYLFGVSLGWLPTFGRGETVQLGWWQTNFLTLSGWKSLLLPAITLGIYQLTLTMRLVRAEMQDVLKTDYIKFATARGVNYRSLYINHAFRNTLVPVVTIIGFLDSIRYVDIPVMSVYLVLIALMFVIINLLVDILYFAIDPRVRLKSNHG